MFQLFVFVGIVFVVVATDTLLRPILDHLYDKEIENINKEILLKRGHECQLEKTQSR